MSDNEIMKQWKKSSIVIGSPTNILAALTSFIPVIWLCTTYDCWPPISTVLTAWGMVAASFGAFYCGAGFLLCRSRYDRNLP